MARHLFVGLTVNPAAIPSLTIHWLYFHDPWVSDLHKDKVTRFWTLYLEPRGALLTAFTSDLPTALQSFQQNPLGTTAPSTNWTVDTTQTKTPMLPATRNAQIPSPL